MSSPQKSKETKHLWLKLLKRIAIVVVCIVVLWVTAVIVWFNFFARHYDCVYHEYPLLGLIKPDKNLKDKYPNTDLDMLVTCKEGVQILWVRVVVREQDVSTQDALYIFNEVRNSLSDEKLIFADVTTIWDSHEPILVTVYHSNKEGSGYGFLCGGEFDFDKNLNLGAVDEHVDSYDDWNCYRLIKLKGGNPYYSVRGFAFTLFSYNTADGVIEYNGVEYDDEKSFIEAFDAEPYHFDSFSPT